MLADDKPITKKEFAEIVARSLGTHHLYTFPLPNWMFKLVAGNAAIESACAEIKINNSRLRKTGFKFEFPTVNEGIPNVVKEFKKSKHFVTLLPLLFLSIAIALFSILLKPFVNKTVL